MSFEMVVGLTDCLRDKRLNLVLPAACTFCFHDLTALSILCIMNNEIIVSDFVDFCQLLKARKGVFDFAGLNLHEGAKNANSTIDGDRDP